MGRTAGPVQSHVMADIESNIVRRRMALIATVVTLVIVVAAIWAAFALLQPTPPRKVVMSTGPEGSAYAHFGELYREIFAREGIDLELRTSAGALENLARLNDPQSGVSGELKFLETELDRRAPGNDVHDLSARLDKLEERANHFRMPTAFTHMLYTLRLHISLVRDKLAKR